MFLSGPERYLKNCLAEWREWIGPFSPLLILFVGHGKIINISNNLYNLRLKRDYQQPQIVLCLNKGQVVWRAKQLKSSFLEKEILL